MTEDPGSGGGVSRLTLSGEIDIAVIDTILAEAIDYLETGTPLLEVDLEAVTFIDSSGLGALVRIRNEAEQRGTKVVLANLSASLQRLLELSGLSQVFEIDPDERSRP